MTKEIYNTFNIVYKREYFSDEDTEWFFIGYSIYKNVPIEKIKYYRKQLLNIKKWADNQYKEDATNFTGTGGNLTVKSDGTTPAIILRDSVEEVEYLMRS